MIAVDAMGGDFAPRQIVLGAIAAAKRNIPVCLFGDQAALYAILQEQQALDLSIKIVATTQSIGMAEEPTKAVIEKNDASLVAAVQAVQDGDCAAIVSAGNTGACVVAGTLLLHRVTGVLRPAIGNQLPTCQQPVFCIDLGANPDSKPEWLVQFAHMGALYQQLFAGIENPRVGLLSNGTEPYKGSRIHKQAYELLSATSLHFIGNVEPADVVAGSVDVLVTDGFTGNIFLKTMEATSSLVSHVLRKSIRASWFDTIWFGMRASLFARAKTQALEEQVGGALLFGLQKPLIVAHGNADAVAIERAIVYAYQVVQEKRIERFNQELVSLLQPLSRSVITPVKMSSLL